MRLHEVVTSLEGYQSCEINYSYQWVWLASEIDIENDSINKIIYDINRENNHINITEVPQ